MPAIMADNDVQGELQGLLKIFQSHAWRDVWERLGITVESFATLKLDRNAPDAVVWRTCQARGVVLFTGNRNNEGPDSLEATIRSENQLDSLPVITLSNAQRTWHDNLYVHRVAEKVLEILLDLDARRGAGRLYVP